MRNITSVVVVLALSATCSSLWAGAINLNDIYNGGSPFSGTEVLFANVVESNGGPGAATNYYQNPTVNGNTLHLVPENLRVELLPGPGIVSLGSKLVMDITAADGYTIGSIALAQLVEYSVRGRVANDATGEIVTDYAWEVLQGMSTGTTGSGTVSQMASAAPNANGSWSPNVALDLGTEAPGATQVRFEFDNQLDGMATSAGLSYVSFLQQPGIDVTVRVVPVPEPLVSVCGLAGVAALAAARRRRAV